MRLANELDEDNDVSTVEKIHDMRESKPLDRPLQVTSSASSVISGKLGPN